MMVIHFKLELGVAVDWKPMLGLADGLHTERQEARPRIGIL